MKITEKNIYDILSKKYTNIIWQDDCIYLTIDLNKIKDKTASKKIQDLCKKLKVHLYESYKTSEDNKKQYVLITKENYISKIFKDKTYGDVFETTKERRDAFIYYRSFCHKDIEIILDSDMISDFLDDVFNFLKIHVEADFIIYCAKKRKMDPIKYVHTLIYG